MVLQFKPQNRQVGGGSLQIFQQQFEFDQRWRQLRAWNVGSRLQQRRFKAKERAIAVDANQCFIDPEHAFRFGLCQKARIGRACLRQLAANLRSNMRLA